MFILSLFIIGYHVQLGVFHININEVLLILLTGLVAGFINSIAGGGSVLTLPLLIFMGLPSGVANGTNRVSILFQALGSAFNYHRLGVGEMAWVRLLFLPTIAGSLIGVQLALISGDLVFNRILALLMVVVLFLIVFSKPKDPDRMIPYQEISRNRKLVCVFLFFLIGIYGGFIQAGAGFVMLLVLTRVARVNLHQANFIKLAIVAVYTVLALAIFAQSGKVSWGIGSVLAVGMVVGGYLGSKTAVKRGPVFVKWVIAVAIICFSVKLLLF